jgi:hypothetical protein
MLSGSVEAHARWAAQDLFDRGGPARLRVISLHDRALNLQVDEWGHMLILAGPDLYRGPSSAGLDAADFRALKARLSPGDIGCFEDERIEFDGDAAFGISLSPAKRVSFSVPSKVELDGASFTASVEGEIAEAADSHLCSCLFGGGGGEDPFRETIRTQFPRLLRSLSCGNQAEFEDSCSSLVGLGHGSTPTGDDLIHGALIALHYMKRASGMDQPIPRMPPEAGGRTTLLGAHMLEMGMRGLTPQPAREFALDLLAGKAIGPSLAGLCRMGADSGPSIAAGLYLMVVECLKPTLP